MPVQATGIPQIRPVNALRPNASAPPAYGSVPLDKVSMNTVLESQPRFALSALVSGKGPESIDVIPASAAAKDLLGSPQGPQLESALQKYKVIAAENGVKVGGLALSISESGFAANTAAARESFGTVKISAGFAGGATKPADGPWVTLTPQDTKVLLNTMYASRTDAQAPSETQQQTAAQGLAAQRQQLQQAAQQVQAKEQQVNQAAQQLEGQHQQLQQAAQQVQVKEQQVSQAAQQLQTAQKQAEQQVVTQQQQLEQQQEALEKERAAIVNQQKSLKQEVAEQQRVLEQQREAFAEQQRSYQKQKDVTPPTAEASQDQHGGRSALLGAGGLFTVRKKPEPANEVAPQGGPSSESPVSSTLFQGLLNRLQSNVHGGGVAGSRDAHVGMSQLFTFGRKKSSAVSEPVIETVHTSVPAATAGLKLGHLFNISRLKTPSTSPAKTPRAALGSGLKIGGLSGLFTRKPGNGPVFDLHMPQLGKSVAKTSHFAMPQLKIGRRYTRPKQGAGLSGLLSQLKR